MSSRVGSRPKGRMSMDQEVGLSESEEGDDGSDLEEMEVRAEVDSPPEENQAEKDEKKEKKISKPRAPRPKLTLELLEGPTGFADIMSKFPNQFKRHFQGKGHEISDLQFLLELFSRWHMRVFPHGQFDDFILSLEMMSAKSVLKQSLRERRQDLLKLVIADGQERNGNEGNASGWDDPSPSKNGKSGDGGQDRGTGRWANLSDDDSDGAGSDFEGVGTKEGRSKGPAEHASAPKPASAWQEYDDDADEFADMLGGHEDNEDDADDFRRQQEEAALEAMPDLDDWDEPRAISGPTQSTKRLRAVSHEEAGEGADNDAMLEDDEQEVRYRDSAAAQESVTGFEDGTAMEDELLALMGNAIEHTQGEAGQKKRRVLVDSDDES